VVLFQLNILRRDLTHINELDFICKLVEREPKYALFILKALWGWIVLAWHLNLSALGYFDLQNVSKNKLVKLIKQIQTEFMVSSYCSV